MRDLEIFKEGPGGCQYDNERVQMVYDKIIPRIEKRFEIIFSSKLGRKGLLVNVDFASLQMEPLMPLVQLCDDANVGIVALIQCQDPDCYMGYSKSQMSGIHRSEQNQARLLALRMEQTVGTGHYNLYFSTGDDLDLPIFIILKRKD